MKHDRLQELVKILIAQHDFITIADLAESLHVSQRTIHNYIDSYQFNQIIEPAALTKIPNKGILLNIDALEKSTILMKMQSALQLNYDKRDDFCKILLRLLTTKEEISQDTLCSSLYLSLPSLNTLLNDMEEYLGQYHCSIEHRKRRGILLHGSETNIRNLFYSFLTTTFEITNKEAMKRISAKTYEVLHTLLHKEEVTHLIHIIDISENIMNTFYCDEDYNRLLLYLGIIILRTRLGFYMPNTNLTDIATSQEYYYATLKKTYLEKDFHIVLNEGEVCYIALLLLGTRKQVNVMNSQQNMIVLEKFIHLLSMRLNVELSNDFELKQNLLNHLKPAIHRMKHGVVSKNLLLEQIRLNFTEVYIAVNTTIEDLEVMENIYFDSNEIGYICLHIIAAINRPENCKKINACLICNEGLSIELFLKNIIESYFKEINITEIFRESSLQELQTNTYDLIINSTTQPIKSKNSISIEPSFTQQDHSTIRHYLTSHTTSAVCMEALYRNYLLFFHDQVKDQQELLTKYCDFLYEGGYVKKGFYSSVVSRSKLSSTYIARGIALPHGAKNEVVSSVILMINLTTSIKWDNELTDFIILVAANDNDAKNYSTLFRKIMKIAAHDETSTLLKTCNNIEELIILLEKI